MSNERLDILAGNQLGFAYSELYDARLRPVNTARFVFLDMRAETSYGDWDRIATESEAFRTRWASHNVRHNTGVKQLHHPVVGISPSPSICSISPQTAGLTIFTYTAEPDSRSEEALNLRGSWAAHGRRR